jgi:small-conductance mechanosensitive channel
MDRNNNFWDDIIFQLGNKTIDVKQLVMSLAAVIAVGLLYALLTRFFLKPIVYKEKDATPEEKRKIRNRWIALFVLNNVTLLVWLLNLDFPLFYFGKYNISVITVLLILILLSFSSLIDWLFTYVLLRDQQPNPNRYDKKRKRFSVGTNLQFIIYTITIILVLHGLNLDFKLFSFNEGKEKVDFYFSKLFSAILVLLVARLLVWTITKIILKRYYNVRHIEYSSQFAINQILSYVIFVMAFIVMLESLGIKMTLLWGGAAALLVGIGLGLQQTFNDLISGIILLFERTVEVGSVLEISGMVGTVRKIGIRTSIIETRDNLAVIVPNSQLIVDQVINWSHNDDKARFNVSVGVAYGSDTQKVKELLLKVAHEHPDALKSPVPFVRFVSFGEYSLGMELHFWSSKLIPIENIKSDLRFAIDRSFRENDIRIPYPQRDIWMKNFPQSEEDPKNTDL